MRELIIDNGSHFGAHRTNEKGGWNSAFKRAVEKYGTKIIRTSVKHPQTNGKVERYQQTLKGEVNQVPYEMSSELQGAIDRFVNYYNHERYHEALDNVTPADMYLGRVEEVRVKRERIKRDTVRLRRSLYAEAVALGL